MIALRLFHSHHAMSMITEEVPLHAAEGDVMLLVQEKMFTLGFSKILKNNGFAKISGVWNFLWRKV